MLKKNLGFTLLEIMLALGVSTIVLMGSTKLILDTTNAGDEAERSFWIAARRVELQQSIKSTDGWNAILAANPEMGCLSGSSCSAYTSPSPFKMPFNGTLIDGAANNIGFTNKGDLCTDFDEVDGDKRCPVGIELRWQVFCDDSSCKHAQPKITINFKSKEPGKSLANMTSFNLIVFKDPRLETLMEVCQSLGGNLVGINCQIPQLSTTCNLAGGQFVLGFDAQGLPICGKPSPGSCSGSDVATGFNAAGGVVCSPACP